MTNPPALAWDLDPAITHLNHGSFGAVPSVVGAEQARLRAEMEADPVRWFASLAEKVAQARCDMADLLGVDREQLALVLNASAGASSVYDALATGRGPVNVVTTNHGYGAVTMGAQRLSRRTGGRAASVSIPLNASADDVMALMKAALAEYKPDLVVIDQITSATARAFPVDEICRMVRDGGALSLVDGAHAPGAVAHPVCVEADYWVGNLHKFVCAPRGSAVLVARDGGQELFPVIDSWGTYLPYPTRFDHLGTMDLTAWLCAPLAWRHIEETVGWEASRHHAAALLDEATAVVGAALADYVDDPVVDVGMPVSTMRLLRLPGELGADHSSADGLRNPFIEAAGIACAFTPFEGRGYLRLSAHLYNTAADFGRLAEMGAPILAEWARSGVPAEVA